MSALRLMLSIQVLKIWLKRHYKLTKVMSFEAYLHMMMKACNKDHFAVNHFRHASITVNINTNWFLFLLILCIFTIFADLIWFDLIWIHTFLWHWFKFNSWEKLCYVYQMNKTLWERKLLVDYTTTSHRWNNKTDTVLLIINL